MVIIMDDELPKPMKKTHRNLLHKMGKKLEKFEQKLGVPSPNLSHGYVSTSDLSSRSQRSEYDDEEHDTVSLQYHAHGHSDSPKAVRRHKPGILPFGEKRTMICTYPRRTIQSSPFFYFIRRHTTQCTVAIECGRVR